MYRVNGSKWYVGTIVMGKRGYETGVSEKAYKNMEREASEKGMSVNRLLKHILEEIFGGNNESR